MIKTNKAIVGLDGCDTDLCLDLAQIIRALRFRFEQHYDSETAEMLITQAVEDSKRPEHDVLEDMKQFQKATVKGFTKSRLEI